MGVFTLDYETNIRPGLEMAITDALRNEVSAIVIAQAEASALERVYNAYDPTEYTRRESLLDDDAYTAVANGNELTLYAHVDGNTMQPWPNMGDITDIIATGIGYRWKNSEIYRTKQPRPWMDEAIEKGLADGTIEAALQAGLNRQGF